MPEVSARNGTFESLTDPRTGRSKRHYFGEILFMALAAMACGMEGFEDFERFAKGRKTRLAKFLKLPGGPPQRRHFQAGFQKSFIKL